MVGGKRRVLGPSFWSEKGKETSSPCPFGKLINEFSREFRRTAGRCWEMAIVEVVLDLVLVKYFGGGCVGDCSISIHGINGGQGRWREGVRFLKGEREKEGMQVGSTSF